MENKAGYKWLTEMVVHPANEEATEENTSSICLIKCLKCGWYMFGDGWWESDNANHQIGEQIPRYCSHCGAEFED